MAGQVDFLSLCVGLWLSQRTLFALLSLLCTEHKIDSLVSYSWS